MSYYKILGFEKEPFSTSPDPNFLYPTQAHDLALTNTLIELQLKRGLCVILGDVGTGKTTLSRKLIQSLKQKQDFIVYCVLDACFKSEKEFLLTLIQGFEIKMENDENPPLKSVSILSLKRLLEKFLFEKGVIERKNVVLIVDEAQKLNKLSIEVLRSLLNYETNENKLLQLVLLGQLELHQKLMKYPNFLDRISSRCKLNPLGFQETKEMISFRIHHAGNPQLVPLFNDDAIGLIHEASLGYPRKITLMCHRALKNLVMKRESTVDSTLVKELIDEDVHQGWLKPILH